MSKRNYLIAGMLAALQIVASAQSLSAQTAQDGSSQQPSTSSSQSGQTGTQDPSQTSSPSPSQGTPAPSTERTAPATAVSGIAGMQSDTDADDTHSTLPQIPQLLGGKGISTAFVSEMERSNYLRGGLNIGAAYDDNPLLDSSGSVGNGSVSIFPNISIEQTSSRMRWFLGYSGGLTINQRFTSQNQGSHNVNFDSELRLSPHVSLRVAENFSMTTGFFDAGNGTDIVPGSGAPNPSLIIPLATERSSLTTVETNYHFALNDLVGASGSFYALQFTNIPAGTGLANSLSNAQTSTGSAFWLHRISGGDWGGASYRFDRLTFNGGETLVHSFFLVDTFKLSNRFTFSAFAGPQRFEDQTFVTGLPTVESDHWSGAGGADAGWQNLRTSLSAGYSRTISDGGGVLGAVRLQGVHANFRRELVPGWAVSLNANHGSNKSLVVSNDNASSINLTSAGITLERNVGKSIGLRMGYSHDFQEQLFVPAAGVPTLDAHRNRAFITLSYQWAKPLGM